MISRDVLRHEVFMSAAVNISRLGTCSRSQVGAVIIRDGRCISWGYNGAPPGVPHCQHTTDEPCTVATHAEANALAFAARQGISTEGATLYVTVSPCETCAKLLIAAGIARVFYRHRYRDDSGIRMLKGVGMVVLTDEYVGG